MDSPCNPARVAAAAGAVLAALFLAACADGQRPDAVRIMPLGDSITQGAGGHDSYRWHLWRRLEDAGYAVDFVGSEKRNYWGPPLHTDFDPDHEGHWGWRADQVLAKIATWAAQARPDIVLMHLGTNDILRGEDPDQTTRELSLIVAALRAANPRVTVLVARIIPAASPAGNARIEVFNGRLDGLAAALDTDAARVILVDQFTGFDAQAETYDGLHPHAAGAAKMAARWFDALAPLLTR